VTDLATKTKSTLYRMWVSSPEYGARVCREYQDGPPIDFTDKAEAFRQAEAAGNRAGAAVYGIQTVKTTVKEDPIDWTGGQPYADPVPPVVVNADGRDYA
jgi:hypothetical protein